MALILIVSSINCNHFDIFESTSFSIKSSISKLVPHLQTPVIHLVEHYSHKQKRARLRYDLNHDQGKNQDYFYDGINKVGLLYFQTEQHCAAGDLNTLYEYLFPDSAMAQLIKSLDHGASLDHLIGPARILLLISKYHSQLVETPNQDEIFVRNHHVSEYQMVEPLGNNNDVQISFYFDKQSLANHKSITQLIPIQVVIIFQKSDLRYNIDFYEFKQQQQQNSFHTITDYYSLAIGEFANSQRVALDLFAFPVSIDCSNLLKHGSTTPYKQFDLFESYDLSAIRFSFSLDTEQFKSSSKDHKHFLAYDGMIRTMRIDTKIKADHLTTHIMDFQTNRDYLIIKKNQEEKCVITHLFIHLPNKATSGPESGEETKLSSFLLGARKFTFMGRAKVDGMFTKVYESCSEKLPLWMSQPTVIKDLKGSYILREKNMSEFVKGKSRKYSIVVYVRDKDDNYDGSADSLGPIELLLVEIYDLAISRRSSYRKLLMARFYNFIWDLNDSPLDGDKVDELFSSKDSCAESRADKYAQVDLLLEEDEFNLSDKDFGWLESPADRNKAIIAALKESLNLQTVMLYDLESRTRFNPKSGKRTILVEARVAEHPHSVQVLNLISDRAMLTPLNLVEGSSYKSMTAYSLTECLSLLQDGPTTKSHAFIYFYEKGKTCLVDLELNSSKNNMKIEESKLFKLDMNFEKGAEIYRVDFEVDNDIKLANSWLEDGKFCSLENRILLLQNLVPADAGVNFLDPNVLRTRIRKAKLRNVNYMKKLTSDSSQIQPPATSFQGFSLPSPDGIQDENYNSNLVRRAKLKEHNRLGFEINQQVCQAACLEDLSCRSYSICLRATGNDCLLSQLEFEAPGIKELLTSRDTLKLTKGAKVKVPSDPNEVELIRDRGCELFNKIYLDLFKKDDQVRKNLNSLKIEKVFSEEECAEKCFDKSIGAIKDISKLDEQLKRIKQIDEKVSESLNQDIVDLMRTKYRKNMAMFCDHFFYLDSLISNQKKQLLQSMVNVKEQNQNTDHYCILEDEGITSNSSSASIMFDLELYKFDYLSLYGKEYGFRILESQKTLPEHEAYTKISTNNVKASETDLKVMSDFFQQGKNIQLRLKVQPPNCAQLCFTQTSGLWPACQSFDTVLTHHLWDESHDLICHLNTISMESIAKDDFNSSVHYSKSHIQVWHYEPRFNLIKNFATDFLDLEINHTRGTINSMLINAYSYLGKRAIFIIIALSFASGLLIGVHLAGRLINYLENQDQTFDIVRGPNTNVNYQLKTTSLNYDKFTYHDRSNPS